ncbi:MAG TPA: DNA translocase FtsK [Verrucomicrobiota bacterium]|nr:MAG: DNA translocase SpoIIIE [Verrucomicrobia bacterium ADurb.Bin063]HNW06334.1 DNA translocase FtsK [Verrucomicrobiota bacterium]HOC49497.1 DNA translocase FtsK [Verrucomicrobiota bacterium]HOX61268.1 DNA translocase FtsK [Verrucomicrobiota bacterium]HPI63771.1 DNA translocase FtsK [Verrucomicrobiota bacterium]
MSRKASASSDSSRGFSDIIGIVLMCLAILLMVALLSYHPRDVSANAVPHNQPALNWIGPFGAWMAYGCFLTLGAAAFVLPVVLFFVGVGCFFEMFAYLRRRWVWAVVLLICCMGLLDIYRHYLGGLERNLGVVAGGILGRNLNQHLFSECFGAVGATIIFLMLYFISLLFLTNFQLGDWVRALWSRRPRAGGKAVTEEQALEQRARELQQQARKLQEEVDRAGLGADMQPVPKPTVRDLSVPEANKAARGRKAAAASPAPEPAPADEGEVIPAHEVAAATTAEVLGQPPEPVADSAEARAAGDKAETAAAEKSEGADKPSEPRRDQEVVIHGLPSAASARPRKKPKPIAVAAAPVIGNYQLPPLDFLQHPDPNLKPTESKEELLANARLMQQTLAQFEIPVELGDITKGPTITRYELHPAPGVKLEKITALNNNLAAALKAERIHILAPVPGKSSVGIEVPNPVKTAVIIRDLLESEEWRNTKARIPLALGKDVYGHPIISDLSEMPHLLIAGSTGAGKSVCINAIITSLLYRFPPDRLRFVMIDPKVVELQQYNLLPHLVVPVVTDPKKVILALRWVVNEMEKRYQIFARVGVRNILSFNSRPRNKPLPPREPELELLARKEKVEPGADGFAVEVDEAIVVPREEDIVIPEKLSYIVVIIDELADLMLVAPADVEMAIARITQMARAAGIHCIVATQRPSVDVITGVIKANIPARIAFQVAAKVDSRTILDAMGADKLLGKGDMLFLPPGSAKLIRAQGSLITDQEIQNIVEFIAKQGKPSYELEIHQQLSRADNGSGSGSGIDEDEEIIQDCIEVIRSEQKASVSLLQRRLRLGYGRAARIMDELENRGIVGPSKGAEPRDILIDLDGGGADGRPPQNEEPPPPA